METLTSDRFSYKSCLPYDIPSAETSIQELDSIVQNLQELYDTHQFQHYEFGTDYAPKVWLQVRALNVWLKLKNEIPLSTKLVLTNIFTQASFEATQPVLQVRYSAICCALWRGKLGQEQLRQQRDVIDWLQMIKVVRNLVVLSQCPKRAHTIGGMLQLQSRLQFSELIKHGTPLKMALCMARMFRVTITSSPQIWQALMDEIVSYLGPSEPENLLVMEGLCALIPTSDLVNAPQYIELLLNIRDKVSEYLFIQCIIPVLAEYVLTCHHYDHPSLISNECLKLVTQAVLYTWDIPLLSSQHLKSRSDNQHRSTTFTGSAGSLIRSVQNAYNHKAHTLNSAGFAKLVIYSIQKDDERTLDLLDSLINAVISFCHPSNSGHWSTLIIITLSQLTITLAERIERFGDVTASQIDRYVLILRPAIFMSLHSHFPFVIASSLDILRLLALWSPDLIVPMALSEIIPSLHHGHHQPGRLDASLAYLGRLSLPLVQQPKYKIYLTTLLELSLPHLDANNTKRCFLTLEFFQTVAALTLFEDQSDSYKVGIATQVLPECVYNMEESGKFSDLDEQLVSDTVKGSSAAYPELLVFYMRRIFELLETTSEQRLAAAAASSVIRVLQACSATIFDRLLEISLEEILNPEQQNHDAFAQVCGVFVRTNCAKAFPKMYRLVASNIREEIRENQAGSSRTALAKDSTLLRNLSILNMCLLSSNSQLIIEVADDLRDLLLLIHEKTGVSVIYTVANTIHHTLSALINYTVVFPKPDGTFVDDSKLNIVLAANTRYRWHTFTSQSIKLALIIFKEHIDLSMERIRNSLNMVSKCTQHEDLVTNSLIIIRTAIGAISKLTDMQEIQDIRTQILDLLVQTYQNLSKDNVSVLKEILFVAKIWLCDVGYERSGRMDQHQGTLYDYEKRNFAVKGSRKRLLPPAVLARKALHFYHLRMSQLSQFRDVDSASRRLLETVLIDACFSVYPAVRRNAFSALYTSLKIFSDSELYRNIYEKILIQLSKCIEAKEFERAQGGMALLKYRTFGVQIGRHPGLIAQYYTVCSAATNADHKDLSSLSTFLFFSSLPDVFRLGNLNCPKVWEHVEKLLIIIIQSDIKKLHWREAIFRASALLSIYQNPRIPITSKVFNIFLNGSLAHHPDVRLISVIGVVTLGQMMFRRLVFGVDANKLECYSADANLIIPPGIQRSHNSDLLENDIIAVLRNFSFNASKTFRLTNAPHMAFSPIASQGWISNPSKGVLRTSSSRNDFKNLFQNPEFTNLNESLELVNDEFLEYFFDLQKVEPQAFQDQFKVYIALYFGYLIALVDLSGQCKGNCAGKIRQLVNFTEFKKPTDPADKNWHRVASELLCGMLIVLPIVSQDTQEYIMEQALETMQIVVEYLTPEVLQYWLSGLSFALEQVDFRRLKPLIDYLEQMANPQTSIGNGGVKLSLRMAIYSEILLKTQWHNPRMESCIKQWPFYNHSLQASRESIGDEISIASLSLMKPKSIRDSMKLDDTGLENLKLILDSKDSTVISKKNLSILHLMLRLLQLLGGDVCLSLFLNHGFSLLVDCAAVRDDQEMVVLVTKVFHELGANHFSPENAESISVFISTAIKMSKSSQWHFRIRMLLFIQPFYFNHLMVLSHEGRQRIITLVVNQLHDPQIEVRDLAADTLSGIVRCSPAGEQEKLVNSLGEIFTQRLDSNISLIDRHGAVLGLSALIGAFPYTSPPPLWIPQYLALLAVKFAGDSGIVGKSAKKVLSEFKKTRQDSWYIDQKAFSQEQLDSLDGILWKNYFA